jgi:methyltransferase (TIGR00027 family)
MLLGGIPETAVWVAANRVRESRRQDALFRDPYARLLVGPEWNLLGPSLADTGHSGWQSAVRTYLFDRIIERQVWLDVDTVINLGAGLDARPYRISLPASLNWIEVDHPRVLGYKRRVLKEIRPVCRIRRFCADITDTFARRKLFRRLAGYTSNALIITEGVLVYLSKDEVAGLANDLANNHGFKRWVLDLLSPSLLRIIQLSVGSELERAGARLKFGPRGRASFFSPYGWETVSVQSTLRAAARLNRLPLRLKSLLKDGFPSRHLQSHVCLLVKR